MYNRDLEFPPEKIVEKGRSIFGTFSSYFKKLDISGIKKPYGILPLPTWITDLRIRKTITLSFTADEYIGSMEVLDALIFNFVEVIFWNKNTGKKVAFRKLLLPRRDFISINLEKGVTACFSKKRYLRFFWDRKENYLSILGNMKGDSIRPSFRICFKFDLESSHPAQITQIIPAPIMRRCKASYYVASNFEGSLSVKNPKSQSDNRENLPGMALVGLASAYYPLRVQETFITGIGTVDGKRIIFRLNTSSFSSTDDYHYNENVLFVDDSVYPLPPVKITYPEGFDKLWIIQDTECMVDLSFKPVSDNYHLLSIAVVHVDYHNVCGNFEGTISTNDGQSFNLKNFAGVGAKKRLRL